MHTLSARRAALVDALLSGDFPQTSNRLRSGSPGNYAYCCLGVACHISGLGFFNARNAYTVGYDSEEAIMPPQVRDFYGFSDSKGGYGNHLLTTLNDTGMSFRQIAELIRSEPAGLFTDQPGPPSEGGTPQPKPAIPPES